jgi:hypothetical protein
LKQIQKANSDILAGTTQIDQENISVFIRGRTEEEKAESLLPDEIAARGTGTRKSWCYYSAYSSSAVRLLILLAVINVTKVLGQCTCCKSSRRESECSKILGTF